MNYQDLVKFKKKFEMSKDKMELQNIAKELLDKTINNWLEYDEKGNLKLSKNTNPGDIYGFFNSKILSYFHKECLDKIPDLSYKCYFLLTSMKSDKYNRTLFKIAEDLKEYINSNDFNLSSMSEDDIRNYDGIINTYFLCNKKLLKKIDDNSFKKIKEFLENVSPNYNIRKSRFYIDCWLKHSFNDKKILNLLPKKSKKEYEEYLFNVKENKNGQIENFEEYDYMMYEYLMFFGKDEISISQKEFLFEKIKRNSIPGRMFDSITYSGYFTKDKSGIDILNKNKIVVLKELAARILESNGTIKNCDSIENEIMYEALNDIDDKGKLKTRKYISSMIDYGEDSIELFKYLVRVFYQYGFYKMSRDGLFSDVATLSKEMYLIDSLFENFKPEVLNDGKIDVNGLSRIDYADIGLSIILEEYKGKEYLLERDDVKEAYFSQGMNIYDSRAVRALVRKYLINQDNYDTNESMEKIILEFVKVVVRNPEFNLFKEQEISDLLQLANTGRCEFAKKVEKEVREGLRDNPSYKMNFNKAEEYVKTFFSVIGERPIDVELEDKVDVLLKALTVCRLNYKHGVFPQEFSDFIIKQALNKKSLLHINSDKYLCVLERAVENLALNDCVIKGDDRKEVPLYQIRDYLYRDSVMGSTGNNQVFLKRSQILRLYDGDLYALGTLFHENTHIEQSVKAKTLDFESIDDYLILKDTITSKKSIEYYETYYKNTMHEIDAREKRK